MRCFVEDKHKSLLKVMRTEMDTKVLMEVRDRLMVPGLIGDNSPYSTMPNFLLTFYAKSESETINWKTNSAAMLARIDQLERHEATAMKDKELTDKELRHEFEKFEREDIRLKVDLNRANKRIDKVAYECKPFTPEEIIQTKDIVNNKWAILSEKMSNL